jgi:hypothetical protein
MQKQIFFLNEKLFSLNSLFFIFLVFFFKFQRKSDIFNTESASYNINLQLDIMQNCWKTHTRGP